MRVDLVNYPNVGAAGVTPTLLSEWRVGAILQAVAVRDVSGQLWLDIGQQRYPARIASGETAGPEDGERLQVRVLRNSPVLALETLASPSADSSEAGIASDALRRYVPRQTSPALLLANLAWMAQGKADTAGFPKAVAQAAANLWQALPRAEALGDPATLANAIARSGAFLEANLASADRKTASGVAATDVKALLFTLARALRDGGALPQAARADAVTNAPVPTPNGPLVSLASAPATFALVETPLQQMNELARQTDGALARLTTTQIANSAQDGPVQTMLFELPVRHEDRATVLRMRIERDSSRRNEHAQASWTVEAAVDLGAIGALHARVSMSGQRIGVQLRAESAGVVEALSQRTGELESMLREAGLEVDRIVCLHGMPAGDAGMRPTRLLDIRA